MPKRRTIRWKKSVSTVLHPCSIERVPPEMDVFLCGLYELSDGGDYRSGAVNVYASETGDLQQCMELASGVLDMKVSSTGNSLACALSSSQVAIAKTIRADDNIFRLGQPEYISIGSDEGLSLSLSWDATDARLATSTQAGSICILNPSESLYKVDVKITDAHNLMGENVPVWVVIFDPHNRERVLSGGDDCAMKLWDLRSPETAVNVNRKSHNAGMTSVSDYFF